MNLIRPSHEILTMTVEPLKLIELAGRTCYKSEDKITQDSAKKFVQMLVEKGHHSVIEHANLTVKFVCDRGVSHELVRHRLCAFSQESTRYCNYGGNVTFIIPPWISEDEIPEGKYLEPTSPSPKTSVSIWYKSMYISERMYASLLDEGWTPQQARAVLPNSLKTEIVVTANFREWMHILSLRTSKRAHPQMREVMVPLLKELRTKFPVVFDNIEGV